MNKSNVEVTLVRKSKGSQSPSLYLVKVSGVEVGLLEKFPNSRSDTHPWKAFKGVGQGVSLLGFFYQADGGKPAALKAVVEAAGKAGV